MVTPKSDANAEPLRCHCGNLLARLVAGGVEIKCRRCKRTVVIPLNAKTTTGQDRVSASAPARNS